MRSLVMVNWKRAHNVSAIVNVFRPFVDEVVVWNNSPDSIAVKGARVIQSERNMMLRGRFEAIQHATGTDIMTVDDDFLPTTRDLTRLIHNYGKDRTKLWACVRPSHLDRTYPMPLGWGSIFSRSQIHVINEFLLGYGWSDFTEREADRIFATLVGRKNCHHIPARGKDMGGANDPAIALWRQSNHFKTKDDAVAIAERWAVDAD